MTASRSRAWLLALGVASPGLARPSSPPGAPLPPRFVDATDALGLAEIDASRVTLADLDGDGRPDLVVRALRAGEGGTDAYRVFLNRAAEPGPALPARPAARFVELGRPSGLPAPRAGDGLVFADLDNDGHADAIFTRHLDIHHKDFKEPESHPRTCILRGRGDGTFEPAVPIGAAKQATTTCMAVGDWSRDGRLDLWLGNWYTRYGESNEAFASDLLAQTRIGDQTPPELPGYRFVRAPLPEDGTPFDEDTDAGGRPMYGAMMVTLGRVNQPPITTPALQSRGWDVHLLALNYGRRANRLWSRVSAGPRSESKAEESWFDAAPALGLDGDDIRHGKYPAWLKERAKTDKRFDRADEKPYRTHGNTFDAAVGDIDNDGDFDLFLTEITHAWAGDSSDRSRFLVNLAGDLRGQSPRFEAQERLSVDRVPPIPPEAEWVAAPLGSPEQPWLPRWNQGDLFCELADLDHDGRLDLILCSSDYPDPAPFEQRLRVFHQQADGTFKDATASAGIDHVGAQQLSLGDIDGDGDLDIVVGQSYNRMGPDLQKATNARQGSSGPRMRVFLNQAADLRARAGLSPNGLVIRLQGHTDTGSQRADASGAPRVNRDALGAVVRVTATMGGRPVTQMRQLVGIGGCAGKQHQFIVHFGLGDAAKADRVEVIWPAAGDLTTVVNDVAAGVHSVQVPERRPEAP